MKRSLDVALFVVILTVLGGATGLALSRAFGGWPVLTALGTVAGLALGLGYSARTRPRPPRA